MNRTLMILAAATLAAAFSLPAQDNPLSEEARQAWMRTRTNLVEAAEMMPEANYDYKPAPESQSFRDLVAHVADSAMGQCSAYNGERKSAGAASMTAKADLLKAMNAAMEECDKAYASLTDATASEMIAGRGRGRTKLGTLYGNTIHMEHEYAQMAVHLRANGHVPPSTANRGRGMRRGN